MFHLPEKKKEKKVKQSLKPKSLINNLGVFYIFRIKDTEFGCFVCYNNNKVIDYSTIIELNNKININKFNK